jgi:chromate transport protein ChrA
MLGQRIAGVAGVLTSVGGMMIPAAVITALMTAAYGVIADHPLAHAALAGMGPATGGMTLAQALLLTRDVRQRGRRVIVDLLVVLVAFALLAFTTVSPIAVIVAAAALGAVALRRERPTSERAES